VKLLTAAMLPMFIFAACVVGYVAYQRQEALETSLKGTTSALSDAINSELHSIQSNLALLIAVEDFNHSNMRDLHRRLKRFVDRQRNWSSISISGTDGQQIFSTLRPFGAELPSWSDQKFFTEILQTQKPVTSGYRLGRMTGLKNFSIAYPVKDDGKLQYILVATVTLSFLEDLLKRQGLPENWTATILDRDGIIIGRNSFHDKFAGEPAAPFLIDYMKKNEHFFNTINKDGIKQFGTFNNLPSGWRVYLGMPANHHQMPMTDIMLILISGGIALSILGLVYSLRLSRRIAQPIAQLADSAKMIGKGERPHSIETDIFEVNEVNDALATASDERDESDEKAQKAIELRDNFLSVASHELKTPLTSMNLQSQLLLKMINDPERMEMDRLNRSVSTINSQMKRLTRLIDDLLDISRITAGKLEVNKEPLDLGELTKEIVTQFEGVSKKSQIHFEDNTVKGNFDRNRMEQVITNLISNAIKYGDDKPIHVTVSEDNGRASLKVKDQGIGIEKKDQGRIFERFERLVDNNDVSGLGLGLWIVHRIVTQLEGDISVASEGAGKGSQFTVSIPLN
jgi:signal transduction histidine kinase